MLAVFMGGGTEVIKAGVTIFNGVSNIVQQMETTSNITTTDWQHLVLTWENGDDIQLFVNGNLVGTTFFGATSAWCNRRGIDFTSW